MALFVTLFMRLSLGDILSPVIKDQFNILIEGGNSGKVSIERTVSLLD